MAKNYWSLWREREKRMQNDSYMVVNIRDYLQKNQNDASSEELLLETLSGFSCPINPSIEKFLKERAIEFTKKNQSVTYLVFSKDDATLVGYFTLASKPITIKEGIFSKSVQRKILRVSEHSKERQTFHLSAYLIAQLGKNFTEETNNRITGKQLIKIAIDKVKEIQYMIGGVVAFLEAEKNDKLLDFYEKQNDFKKFDMRKTDSMNENILVQMLVMV